MPRNLLLIQADQWRADCLGAAGHPVLTPHLDELAGQGTRFDRAYSSTPTCIPARIALMTGLSPHRHGRVANAHHGPWRFPTTFAGHLTRHGWQTHACGKMHAEPERNRVGFEAVDLHDGYLHGSRMWATHAAVKDDYLAWLQERRGYGIDYNDSGIGCNGYAVAPWPYATNEHPTAWTAAQAVRFLWRRDRSQPFFLYLSFHRPHPPLDPPAEYLRLYERLALPPPAVGDWAGRLSSTDYLGGHEIDTPVPTVPAAIDLARRAYLAQLTFIDHQINRVLMAISETLAADNTVIAFTSDHGEMLYDHSPA
jgi:arylsulfatase A-like enzyme